MHDNLGDRMKKNYEDRQRHYLTRRTPVILRVDGVAFHTFTRGMERPFCDPFNTAMVDTAQQMLKCIQGAVCAYVQSDEISFLLIDYRRFNTEAWFNYNIQKMVSNAASIAAAHFNVLISPHTQSDRLAYFDGRVFNIPRHDVANYFVWRQQDWIRNSVQMLAQSHYSHKEIQNKNVMELKSKLIEDRLGSWENLDGKWKYGTLITKDIDCYGKYTKYMQHIGDYPSFLDPLLKAEEE